MTKGKRNRSSGATAALALISAGIITVGQSVKQQANSTPWVLIAVVAALLIYIYKIRR